MEWRETSVECNACPASIRRVRVPLKVTTHITKTDDLLEVKGQKCVRRESNPGPDVGNVRS
jgi:hypothetical protein